MRLLFQDGDLRQVLDQLPSGVRREVESQDPDYILGVSVTDLTAHLVEKYTLDPPMLDEESIYVHDQGEARIDVSGDRMRYFSRPGPHYVQGTSVTIAVPFSGDPDLFKYQPSRFTYNPPKAEVRKGELRLVYIGQAQTAEQVESRYKSDVATIAKWLTWISADVAPYNEGLEQLAAATIEQRREKVLADRSLVHGLGLPVRARRDEPRTYVVPDVRKKARIEKPVVTGEAFVPEPELDATTYEEILSIVRSMARVMERSPSAFEKMSEENLRQHFLVQLNGRFEGDATGETFNFEGKTDILIRRDDRNVFIAECKYWTGPSGLTGTIDQMLGYLSWRDTKTAILLFVRNRNFSAVVDKIVPVVEAHPSWKKTLDPTGETEFRFILGQRDDPNRELRLAALLFPVPRSGEEETGEE